jgi:hypothetical protein
MKQKLPKLPQLLDRKIYKTGQTRGADDDVIYQNRVARNSTVLIPFQFWGPSFTYPPGESSFENGFIVLISPNDFFENENIKKVLAERGLSLGRNCLVCFETREQWDKYNPNKLKWKPAKQRSAPLRGSYIARVPATTALDGGQKIILGFTSTKSKGAGIRLYEYASSKTIAGCKYQLEAMYWLCFDSEKVAVSNGMLAKDVQLQKSEIIKICKKKGLLDFTKLADARILNREHKTICPLCLEELSGASFFSRMAQAEGREVPDLTVTEINLFHIKELRYGEYNHRPYNIAWGHHHCNVVTRDSGIEKTLEWMRCILERNIKCGYKLNKFP